MITLKQVDSGEVSPKDDGLLYDFLINQSGIFEGCTVTHNGANQLVIANGRGIVKGRMFEIVSETVLSTLSPSGTKQGRLIVKIDLADLSEPIKFVTQVADSLPVLTQQDLNRGGTVYELPLATYLVSPTVISELGDARTIITAVTISPTERVNWNSKAAGDASGNALNANKAYGKLENELNVASATIAFELDDVEKLGFTQNLTGTDENLKKNMLNNPKLKEAFIADAPVNVEGQLGNLPIGWYHFIYMPHSNNSPTASTGGFSAEIATSLTGDERKVYYRNAEDGTWRNWLDITATRVYENSNLDLNNMTTQVTGFYKGSFTNYPAGLISGQGVLLFINYNGGTSGWCRQVFYSAHGNCVYERVIDGGVAQPWNTHSTHVHQNAPTYVANNALWIW